MVIYSTYSRYLHGRINLLIVLRIGLLKYHVFICMHDQSMEPPNETGIISPILEAEIYDFNGTAVVKNILFQLVTSYSNFISNISNKQNENCLFSNEYKKRENRTHDLRGERRLL